jgi:hypothetical protein
MRCPVCRSLMLTEAAAAKNEILWHHCPRCHLDLIRKHGRTVWPKHIKNRAKNPLDSNMRCFAKVGGVKFYHRLAKDNDDK